MVFGTSQLLKDFVSKLTFLKCLLHVGLQRAPQFDFHSKMWACLGFYFLLVMRLMGSLKRWISLLWQYSQDLWEFRKTLERDFKTVNRFCREPKKCLHSPVLITTIGLDGKHVCVQETGLHRESEAVTCARAAGTCPREHNLYHPLPHVLNNSHCVLCGKEQSDC